MLQADASTVNDCGFVIRSLHLVRFAAKNRSALRSPFK